LQYRRVEPFGEPVVDGCEKIAGFAALALIVPEAGKAGGSARLKDLALCRFAMVSNR
jgi:hypothetical protein